MMASCKETGKLIDPLLASFAAVLSEIPDTFGATRMALAFPSVTSWTSTAGGENDTNTASWKKDNSGEK